MHLLRDSFELVHHRAHGVGELPAGIVEVVLHVLTVKRPNGLRVRNGFGLGSIRHGSSTRAVEKFGARLNEVQFRYLYYFPRVKGIQM